MVEKRKRSSTIHVRGSTSQSAPTSTLPAPPSTPEIPTSFTKDGSLPILSTRQPDDLSLRDFKSVAESKVLAESLARSQRRWVEGEIFERIWIKPLKTRKLSAEDIEKNPSKESMIRLGPCTMSCMPHKFDIKLWALMQPIKQPPPTTPAPPPPAPSQSAPPQPQLQQQPQQQPSPQQGQPIYNQQTQSGVAIQQPLQTTAQHPPAPVPNLPRVPQPQIAPPQPSQSPQPQNVPLQPVQKSAAPSLQQPTPSAVPTTGISGPNGVQPAPQPAQQIPQQQRLPVQHPVQMSHVQVPQQQQAAQRPPLQAATPGPPPQQPMHQQQQGLPQQRPPHQGPPQGQHGPPGPRTGQDPVIQMLAMKAATDSKLKGLMRVVASGKASKEELQEFQGHIDILTSQSNLHQQRGLPPPPLHQQQQQPMGQAPPGQMYHHPQHPQHQIQQQQMMAPPINQLPYLQHPQQQLPLYHQQQLPHNFQQYPQQHVQQRPYQPLPTPKVKQFPPAPKHEIVGILIEFVNNYSHGDRFLFPKHSIIEYLDRGTTMKASFIVTRKIDDIEEFYQPVTVVFSAATPRVLENFSKVIAYPEVTRTHMKEIMGKLDRAEDTYLVYRLRREPGEPVPSKASVETKMLPPVRSRKRESISAAATAGTPRIDAAATPPARPRIKHVKKPLSSLVSTPMSAATSPPPPPSATLATPATPAAFIPAVSTTQTPTPVFTPTAAPRSPEPRTPKPTRSRKGRIADPTKSCHLCHTSQTSLWRKADIDGENATVCNACGIKWKTNAQKQALIAAAIAKGEPIPEDLRRTSSMSGLRPEIEALKVGGPVMPTGPPGPRGGTLLGGVQAPTQNSVQSGTTSGIQLPIAPIGSADVVQTPVVAPVAVALPPHHHPLTPVQTTPTETTAEPVPVQTTPAPPPPPPPPA